MAFSKRLALRLPLSSSHPRKAESNPVVTGLDKLKIQKAKLKSLIQNL